jgi:hypothetical protein
MEVMDNDFPGVPESVYIGALFAREFVLEAVGWEDGLAERLALLEAAALVEDGLLL